MHSAHDGCCGSHAWAVHDRDCCWPFSPGLLYTHLALAGTHHNIVITVSTCLQYCGALFNLGKALDMQGNASSAAAAFLQAIEVTRVQTAQFIRSQHHMQPSLASLLACHDLQCRAPTPFALLLSDIMRIKLSAFCLCPLCLMFHAECCG